MEYKVMFNYVLEIFSSGNNAMSLTSSMSTPTFATLEEAEAAIAEVDAKNTVYNSGAESYAAEGLRRREKIHTVRLYPAV